MSRASVIPLSFAIQPSPRRIVDVASDLRAKGFALKRSSRFGVLAVRLPSQKR